MISSNGEKHRASLPRLFRWISTHSSTIDEPHSDLDRRFSRKGFRATSPDEIVFLAIRKGLDLSVIRTGDLCTPVGSVSNGSIRKPLDLSIEYWPQRWPQTLQHSP